MTRFRLLDHRVFQTSDGHEVVVRADTTSQAREVLALEGIEDAQLREVLAGEDLWALANHGEQQCQVAVDDDTDGM